MTLMRNVMLSILLLAGPATADWELLEDRWYTMEMMGSRAGWVHEVIERDGDRIRSSATNKLTMSRGADEMVIEVEAWFIETANGEPISSSTTQSVAGQSTRKEWLFGEDGITVKSDDGVRKMETIVPNPEGVWLTPFAVKRFVEERMESDAKDITFRTMSMEIGPKAMTIMMARTGEMGAKVLGKVIPVTEWEVTNDAMPIESIDLYSKDAVRVKSTLNAGFGALVMALASEAEATAKVTVPEMMFSLFAPTDKPIPNGFMVEHLRLRLQSRDGKPVELPSVGAQKAELQDDGATILVIDVNNPLPASDEELADPSEFLASTSMCDLDDALLGTLAAEATADLDDTASGSERARAMREFVHWHINNKGYATMFATASQTARDQTGDCSEHGVLLCGLLRAAGIPARTAMGMVYVPAGAMAELENGGFGWHMWTQALIDGVWVDLDATLPWEFGAGHITTATSSLSETDMMTELSTIMSLIGNVDVEVLSVGAPEEK